MNRTRTRKLLTIVSLILVLCFLPFSNLVAWDPPASVVVIKDNKAAYFKRADGSDLEVGFYSIQGTGEIAYCVDADALGPGGNTYVPNESGITDARYLSAIQAVIQHGYPYQTNGLSVDDARYATQAAIHWLENYYLGGTNGWNCTLIDTVNPNGHDAAFAWARALYNIGVNRSMLQPIVYLSEATGWSNGHCYVDANETDTAYWQVTQLPVGLSIPGANPERTFTGDVRLDFQLNDPVAYAASDKTVRVQGYVNTNTENIRIFTTSGGYQTMAAVSQSMNAKADPSDISLQDATGGFALHKITQTLSGDIPEANAVFQIFSTRYASYADTPDAEKGTITTDADGNASLSGLPYGTYYLDQISAPIGVTLIPRQMVTVGASSISNPVTYLNTLGFGHIDLTKRMNQSGTPYEPGATFHIYLKSAGSYDASPVDQRDQITTDANGHATSKNLPYGEYCMTQISAAPGMKVDTTIREYRIGMDASGNPLIDQTIYESIMNDLAMGRIELHKVTDYTVDVPEANAEFQVFPIAYASYADAAAAGAATAVMTTDANGYAISPYLPFDRYVIIQSKAPAGTIPGFGFFVWIGVVDQAVEHVDLVNQTYWGNIRVQKYVVSPSDPAHVQTPEAGATFRVFPTSYDSYANALANDPKAVDTCDIFTTGADGLGQTTHQLPYGTYTVEQIDNAATANTNKVDPWQVAIGPIQNGVYSYVRENPLYEQFLRIIKTDADTGEAIPIAGAAFEILDASGNVLTDRSGNSVFYTDDTGTVDLSALPLLVGTYGIRETAAPIGYAPSPEILYFTVAKSDHGTSFVTVEAGRDIRTVSIKNRKITGVLEIYKLAADTQLPMTGVVFEVYDKNGNLVDTMTTDAEGKAKTKILPFGVYTLVETKTLTGYKLSDKSTFSIYLTPKAGETFSTTEMTLSNQKMGEIEVYKVTADGTSTPMNGVVFGVYDAKTDTELARMSTDQNGYASVYVVPGSYYLKEISTWDGYTILTDKIMIEDAKYAQVYTFRLTNSFSELKVCKESISGTPLAGMEFAISTLDGKPVPVVYDEASHAYIAAGKYEQTKGKAEAVPVTGDNGEVLIQGLPEGSYVITETKAPDGYRMDASPKTAVITEASSGKEAAVVTLVDSLVTVKTGETDGDTWAIVASGLGCLTASVTLIILRKLRKRSSHMPSDSPED